MQDVKNKKLIHFDWYLSFLSLSLSLFNICFCF